VVDPTFAPTLARLERTVRDNLVGTGAQVWASVDGEVVLDVAVGSTPGGRMTTSLAHQCYCLGKPLVALTLAGLAADGIIDLEAPLASIGCDVELVPTPSCSVLDLLDHRVGLADLTAFEYLVTPRRHRRSAITRATRAAATHPRYSEIVAGVILEDVLTQVTGRPAVEVVEQTIGDLGLEHTAVGPDGGRRLRERDEIGVAVTGLPHRAAPFLFDLTDHALDDLRPAFGILTTAQDLGRLFEFLRVNVSDNPTDDLPLGAVLRRLVTPRHPSFEDPATQREMLMAGGFMVDAARNGIVTRASTNSFGHTSGVIGGAAVADPTAGVSAAVIFNGADVDPELQQLERRAILGEILSLADRS